MPDLHDEDARLIELLSDRDVFMEMLAKGYGLEEEEAREVTARLFYHFMDPWGHLLDRVVDEGDPAIFSREDRRDLVSLANLGIVAVRSSEVAKADPRGKLKTFTQYHYALHLDAIRQRVVDAATAAGALDAEDEEDEPEANEASVYADPSLWARRR